MITIDDLSPHSAHAHSLGEDGVTLWLVDGERRLRATIRPINDGAAIESVPVKTVPVGTDEANLVASQLMHNSGRRYSLLELGAVVTFKAEVFARFNQRFSLGRSA